MTPAGFILRDEISRHGPIPLHRFMEVALYHAECGYYRGGRDPFGRQGDYFTAEQIQPVFGILVAARLRQLREELGSPPEFTVVELGAGRGEMREALAGFRYHPVEFAAGDWPSTFTGVVFCNEFFDALPVDAAVRRATVFREMLVGWEQDRFAWVEGPPLSGEHADFVERYAPDVEDGTWVEVNLNALRWLDRIAERLERGYVFIIDYGFTMREFPRYPRGTLMGYSHHRADEDILVDPGERDITSHVPFTALQEHGSRLGLATVCLETLAKTLATAGEPDSFAEALASGSPPEQLRRRLQLKTLLFGMGETFRTLLLRKT